MAAADDAPLSTRLTLLFVFGALSLVFVTIIALIGLQLVGGVTDAAGGAAENRTASPDPITGQYVNFDSEVSLFAGEILQVYSVNDSTGFGIRLDGSSGSYVQSRETVQIAGDDTWTVSTWARVRDGAEAQNMTVVDVGGRVLIQYNGSQGNWTAWYYDDGSSSSWRVNASAPNQPGNLTNVMVVKNSTHLTIYRNNTLGETVNVTAGSNSIDAQTNSTNFNGTIDETRTFDDPLNDSQRASLVNDPVFPLENATRTARITYDEGSGTTTQIYFTSTVADINEGEWVTALAGTELTEGTDYELRERTAAIQALDGGRIDGAPVVWIDYEFQDSDVSDLVPGIKGGFDLLAVGVLVIPATAIIGALMFGLMFALRSGSRRDGLGFGRDRGR